MKTIKNKILCACCFTVVAFLLTSCAHEQYGDFSIVWRENIQDDYHVYVMQNHKDDEVRFCVDFKGLPICETSFSLDSLSSMIKPYRSKLNEVDNLSVFYDDDDKGIKTVRVITQGDKTVFIIDRIGDDGFPETRGILDGSDNRKMEDITPTFSVRNED
jgi:hypothetical protein